MAFDNVSLPAAVFVCITTVLALVGNSLVLLIFGCRWRSTNDSKIYIMTLAVLDLLCVLVSSPRDLMTLLPASHSLLKGTGMHVYCKVSVFFTHHLNVASALILVAIAASRFVKVTRKDAGNDNTPGSGRGAPGAVRLLATLKRLLRGVSTVHGAKVSSTLALCVAFVQVCPSLVLYGSGEDADDNSPDPNLGSSPGPENVSAFVLSSNGTNITTTITTTTSVNTVAAAAVGGGSATHHWTCRDDIHAGYEEFRQVFDISQFALFSLLTVFMVGIYMAILGKLCCQQSRRRNDADCCESDWRRRESTSIFSLDEPSSSLVLFHQNHDGDSNGDGGAGKGGDRESSSRCVVITADSVVSAESESSSAPVSPVFQDSGQLCSEETSRALIGARGGGGGGGNNTFQTRNPKQLNFSLSYSSDHEVALTRQTSQGHLCAAGSTAASNRLSTASFQLAKTGNPARLTTLVFLMVTSIYILSYFPYFVSILYEYLIESGAGEPWERWTPSCQAVMLICKRSYLIANAANPLVYGLCNPYFREQLGKLLICRRDVI